jgi:hypothetical protein
VQALEGGRRLQLFLGQTHHGNRYSQVVQRCKGFWLHHAGRRRRRPEGTARAIEWARTTPRDQVVARLKKIVEARHRNEDATIVNYWKSPGVGGKGGLIAAEDFTTYIDWYVKNGVLKPGQVKPETVYSNQFNPFNQAVASH